MKKNSLHPIYIFNRYACLIVAFTVSKYYGNITDRKYQTAATSFQNSAELFVQNGKTIIK